MEQEPKNKSFRAVGSFIFELVKIVLLAFLIIIPVRVFLFQPFFVQGASMEPNFEDGQYLIINEFGYKETNVGFNSYSLFTVNPFKDIERERVIVFRYPLDPNKYFIKRVIGLPGEKIQIKNGNVTIYNGQHPDGMILDEKAYLPDNLRTGGDMAITLSDNEYFVMGDNRTFSSDSRVWGPVPKKDVIGEVLLRAWPPNKLSVY